MWMKKHECNNPWRQCLQNFCTKKKWKQIVLSKLLFLEEQKLKQNRWAINVNENKKSEKKPALIKKPEQVFVELKRVYEIQHKNAELKVKTNWWWQENTSALYQIGNHSRNWKNLKEKDLWVEILIEGRRKQQQKSH